MFSTTIQLNRQSSTGGFYFLFFLFLLHICTAFLTVINALDSDNEAIIQFSANSIHVVKSSDPRITNIEENASNNEEKELLKALLTSYDNDYKTNKQNVDEIRIENNSSSSSSVRFVPPLLNFNEQLIAIPQMQTVMIINDDSEPLELFSLSGTTIQFYSSFYEKTILAPNGGNTSIHVYYLPRTVGITKSIFTIKTNRGDFYYYVNGVGKLNPFSLRPLVDAVIPLNSTFEYTVHFRNPYNYSIDINEIYTSDENLVIELLSYRSVKNKITKKFEHDEQWRFRPFEIKPIIKIIYFAYQVNQLNGFVCIKTNSSDTIIIPVEINVLNRPGLYLNIDFVEFTADRFVRSIINPITVPVHAINYGLDPVTITDVHVPAEHRKYLTVQYKNLPIPADIHRLNQILDITLHPKLIPIEMQRVHGFLQVYTSFDNEKPTLKVPFDALILHGSVDFKTEEAYFHIPSSTNELSNAKTAPCRSIHFINIFNTTVVVYNVTTSSVEASKYIKIDLISPYLYMNYGQWTELFCVTVLKPPLSSVLLKSFEALIHIHTNISFFTLPFYLYNGLLNLNIFADNTNGGIRRDGTNAFEFSITSIPVNVSRTVKFILINSNPIDITIEKYDSTLSNADVQLDYMQSTNGSEVKIMPKALYINQNISQLVIPKQHQAIFSLTIVGVGPPQFYNRSITFETSHQTLQIDLKYQIIKGSVELTNKLPLQIDVSPNRAGAVDIFLHNKLDEPTNISRMDFISYGVSLSFTWADKMTPSTIIEPNKILRIGKLNFDINPYCKTVSIPSESTSYCGLNNHPKLKQRWDEYVTALNTQELDRTLVVKFRAFWKEWTSNIRKQQIQTNVWLYTHRANISWPVVIGFIWPSVLEQMSQPLSRAPVILDFQVTSINVTKTQNVIITNPSSSHLLTYSVELLSNKTNNNLVITDQVFTISVASKRVGLNNGIYKFTLSPNEQIVFTVSYRPTLSIKNDMYLVVRNNLTTIESILLRGEGGIGSLQVGNRQAGSSTIPIILQMTEKQHKLCSLTNDNPKLVKYLTLRNTGKLKIIIHDISFGNSKCSGQGFLAETCTNIEINTNEEHNLKIQFQPDYTINEINEILILNTNIGLMTFRIIVRIPQRVLSTCYKAIPRPPWELRTYCLCLCSLVVFIILIFSTAVYDARRLFDNYLSRAEWRDRIQMTDNKIFDLSDLSLAVQDEQKTRERIESHLSTNTAKEKIIETSNNEIKIKPKRSITSTSGNGETSSKLLRPPDGYNTTARSIALSPKAIPHKTRRATTDSGQSKPSKQQQQQQQPETPSKPQPLRRRTSANSAPKTSIASHTAVSSSAVSDEESEPFVVARPRRVSTKSKESSTNITSKSISPTDDANPLQPAPSSSPLVIQKPSIHFDQFEQQQPEKDLSLSTESTKDQQWQMVSSNRGQRKGTTTTTTAVIPRREYNDESQTTNKTVKILSTDPENPMVPLSPSSSSAQSRRRRGRRSTRKPSPTPVHNLSKRKSLQNNKPFIIPNRELAFRQLAEQLWAAGLPSSATACSMSIRSRCSSAPPSERGGDGDETKKIDWDDDDEENIEWDEPDIPDDDFGRYVSQTESCMNESNDNNQWTQTATNNIPSLMSLSIAPPVGTTNTQQKSTVLTSVIKENIEPLPFPQRSPGPIQRPNKLPCSPITQPSPFLIDIPQSPSTPDVLVQINHLLDTQNSITTVPSIPSVPNSATIINDISTPNVPWTPFSPSEWSSKYDPSWSATNIQSPNISLTSQIQNPFVQQQASREESSVWSSGLGTATPRPTLSSRRSEPPATWNELFPSTGPSSAKPTNTSWSKFWPAADPSPADGRQENETNNPFWNPVNLNETQQPASTSLWPKTSSDKKANDNDHSRWDFAR